MSVVQGVADSSVHAAETPAMAQPPPQVHSPTPVPSPATSRSSSPTPTYKISPLPSPTPSPYPSRPASPNHVSRSSHNNILSFRPPTRDVLRAIAPHVFLESAPGMQNILARQAGLPPRAPSRYGRRRGWPRRNPTRALTARCDGLRARDAMHARGLRYDPRRPIRGSPLKACAYYTVFWEDYDVPELESDAPKTEKAEKRRSWRSLYRAIGASLGQLSNQGSKALLRPGLPKSHTEPILPPAKSAPASDSCASLPEKDVRTPFPKSRASLSGPSPRPGASVPPSSFKALPPDPAPRPPRKSLPESTPRPKHTSFSEATRNSLSRTSSRFSLRGSLRRARAQSCEPPPVPPVPPQAVAA